MALARALHAVQTGAGVVMNGVATDVENDTPITYQWVQVDENGDPLPVEDALHVTLLNPTNATTGFAAPAGPATRP